MINVWKQQDQQWDQQDCQPDIGAGNKTNHNGGGHQGKQHCDDQMDQPFMLKKTDLCQMVFDGFGPVGVIGRCLKQFINLLHIGQNASFHKISPFVNLLVELYHEFVYIYR